MKKPLTVRECKRISAFLTAADKVSDTLDNEGRLALLDAIESCQRCLLNSMSQRQQRSDLRLIVGGKR